MIKTLPGGEITKTTVISLFSLKKQNKKTLWEFHQKKLVVSFLYYFFLSIFALI